MIASLVDVCCASIPAEALASLAPVRTLPGVLVLPKDDRVWVRWQTGDDRVLRQLLPVAGVVFLAWREGHWYRPGQTLPDFAGPPESDYQPLEQVLVPAPVRPLPPPANVKAAAVTLNLVEDHRPRPTSALLVSVNELLTWTDAMPSTRLAQLQCACARDKVLVLGKRLPAVIAEERFWGTTMLAPLGWRLEPDVPEVTVRAALGITGRDVALVRQYGVDVVPAAALQTLRRARLRQLAREMQP